MPGDSGEPVVTNSYAFLFCMRGCGRIERPAFPAPSEFQMRFMSAKLARLARRDRAGVFVLRDEIGEICGKAAAHSIPPPFVGRAGQEKRAVIARSNATKQSMADA